MSDFKSTRQMIEDIEISLEFLDVAHLEGDPEREIRVRFDAVKSDLAKLKELHK